MNQQELEKRLRSFALRSLRLVRALPKTPENRIYGNQLIRASSSVGANYAEATCASTKRDFTYDINKCRKEANESVFGWNYYLPLILYSKKECSPCLMKPNKLSRFFKNLSLPPNPKNDR